MNSVNLDPPGVQGVDPDMLTKASARLEHLYGLMAESWPGFVEREGQYQMMHAALQTFLRAKAPGDISCQGENLAQIEAGTGTGKTVAYCLAAIVASELLKKNVIISSSTVTLQEQLFFKDLPQLAKIIPSLRFDILKGRGRYVCASQLKNIVEDTGDEGFPADDFLEGFLDNKQANTGPVRENSQTMTWCISISKKLQSGKWDGDIDTLEKQPFPDDWRRVQANSHSCTAGQCEFFANCAFFKARRQASTATLQVANHALILSTLQTESTLIDPANTLFVFDEAHHLPSTASDQFSYRVRLGTSSKLLSSLTAAAMRCGRDIPIQLRPDPVSLGASITQCINCLSIFEEYWTNSQHLDSSNPVFRFVLGHIPEQLVAESNQIVSIIASIMKVVKNISASLAEKDDSKSPSAREEQARAYVEMNVYLTRLEMVQDLFRAWATHDKVPLAKWMEYVPGSLDSAGSAGPIKKAPSSTSYPPDAWLCASPMTAAQLLSNSLWKNVSAAVCTSATLTACGSFDFFDRLSGMNRFPSRKALIVKSPFDFSKQGEFRIASMKHNPKSAEFSSELCQVLPGLLREHKHGQLILFTSKRQLNACHTALPSDLMDQVQVQGVRSRTELLREHGRRISNGERSIIFGLQSFGEGIDLPGKLCEHVLIDKLPFTPPSSPIEEALAEWLTSQGRDPFSEISVPRAAMKLAQWAGRGVRTETDRAVITVCDTRLRTMRYGRTILAGLPPFNIVANP